MSRQDNLAGKNVLLTGATGLIGGEILRRLTGLGQAGPKRIICLVRSPTPAGGTERLLQRLGLPSDQELDSRVAVVTGDLRRPALALAPDVAGDLRSQIDVVIHCAATTYFLKRRECQQVNVGGLCNLLDFVSTEGRRILFAFFSSAAACGDRRDACLIEEDYPRWGDRHFVHYTRTKAVAEKLLRRRQAISNRLILRPSVVLPDNVSESSLINGVLWALVLMKEVSSLPISSDTRIDAVPVSFVGECAIRLIAKPDRKYDCYHISAGERDAPSWHEVLSLLRDLYQTEIRCCGRDKWAMRARLKPREKRLLRVLSWYLPFINQNVVFCNKKLRQELNAPSPEIQRFHAYLPDLLQHITLKDALIHSQNP